MNVNPNFESKCFGKCIIAGEHAVIRGGTAVVFPVMSCSLNAQYFESKKPLEIISENIDRDFEQAIIQTLDLACDKAKVKMNKLLGELRIKNSVPVGSGLGASAVLCVTIARFFNYKKWILEEKIIPFATDLENFFHGKSSGVDIAVVQLGEPIKFQKDARYEPLNLKLNFQLYVTYTGEKSKTSDCVKKVSGIFEKEPELGHKIDQQMKKAVSFVETESMDSWIKAFEIASNCFELWGLVTPQMIIHMSWVLSQGALGLKPTGSGGGGYILSIWDKLPPQEFLAKAIKV